MSIQVMSRVWESSRAKEGALLVLLSIADHAGDDGKAYPSTARLARRARMDQRNARRCIRKLEALGELRVDVGKGPRGCNLYRVLVADAEQTMIGAVTSAPRAKRPGGRTRPAGLRVA